MHGTGY